MPERIITDAAGAEWTVIDVGSVANRQHHRIPATDSAGWLSFTRGDGFRVRVDSANLGADWRKLRASELRRVLAEALSDTPS